MLCRAAKKQTKNKTEAWAPSILKAMVTRLKTELLIPETGESITLLFPTIPKAVPKSVQILEVRAMNCELSCPEHIYKSRLIT